MAGEKDDFLTGALTGALVSQVGATLSMGNTAANLIEEKYAEKRKAREAELAAADAQNALAIAKRQIEQMQEEIDSLAVQLKARSEHNFHKDLADAYLGEIKKLKVELDVLRHEKGVEIVHLEMQKLREEQAEQEKQLSQKDAEMAALRRERNEWMASAQFLAKLAAGRRKRLGLPEEEVSDERAQALDELSNEHPLLMHTEYMKNLRSEVEAAKK